MYEGIQSEIVNATWFDENSGLNTTCLGKSDRSINDELKAEETFPTSEQGYTLVLCKAVLASIQFALYFFKCLGGLHFISLYVH